MHTPTCAHPAHTFRYASNNWAVTTVYNWNTVCNGGLLAGAIAFADVPSMSSLAAGVYANATTHIKAGFSSYAPTGGWPEGTTYWGYGTKYALLASELLFAINQNDEGLSATPGFADTGRLFHRAFRVYRII